MKYFFVLNYRNTNSEKSVFPACISLFITMETPKTKFKICSKLIIKTPEWRQWRVRLSLLLTLKNFLYCSGVPIVDFEQINTSRVNLNIQIIRRRCILWNPCHFLQTNPKDYILKFQNSTKSREFSNLTKNINVISLNKTSVRCQYQPMTSHFSQARM